MQKPDRLPFAASTSTRTSKARSSTGRRPYQDYREMLEKEGDKIDAVTIGIPDHMHAIATLDALRSKKRVFCQKPLTHTVWEARQVRLQAEKSGVITRMGNQIHSHGLPHGSGARTIGCNWKSKTGSFLDQCDGAW